MTAYSRVVFQSHEGSSLFDAHHIKSMCSVEFRKIRLHSTFVSSCVPTAASRTCCRSWSLGNYIALLSNRTSCFKITEDDVQRVQELLLGCAGYYHNRTLLANCADPQYVTEEETCDKVPLICKQHDAVYNILHYLTDTHFMAKKEGEVYNTHLTYAMTFLPIAAGIGSQSLYRTIQEETLSDDHVEIIAINFGIKQELFDYYLKKDYLWFGIALVAIFLTIWFYTTSLLLTVMTVTSIFLSLEISYFLYTMVFKIQFFPFMNLLTVVILVGIGADDVFIYCKVWSLAKHEKNVGTLEKIISDTLRHATLSMFVTSFTTAGAFYASYVSNITALNCFAIYAGTAILINFLMMVTWIPAAIVIHEKWCSECFCCYSPDIYSRRKGWSYFLCRIPYSVYTALSEWSAIFFDKLLPYFVIKLRYMWVLTLGGLGVAGLIIVLYHPKLKLPSSNEFQLFAQEHPFEVYDFRMKDLFWFEKAAGMNVPTMPLTVVWGVKATDTGNMLDPYSVGTLSYDESVNIATPSSQRWLKHFCDALRSSRYYQHEPGIHMTDCFIEQFQKFMSQPCAGVRGEDNNPCCRVNSFPYKEAVFRQCLTEWLKQISRPEMMYYVNHDAGPRLARESGKLVALVVEFSSNEPFSFNYEDMKRFYTELNQFIADEMLKAPPEMRSGWFVSHLGFYDLQESLAHGTPLAIGVSITITSIMAFITTLNVLISLYAIVSITACIFVTVASLVLLGWELNILESVTISIAVGLSIDFTLHYGMAYRLSPDLDREMRVVCATSRMGSPVAMAALTTFLAGALIMPSVILAYQKLGIFLMLVMSISWIYSTFFYQSLLRIIGPQGGFGQFYWPSSDCCSGQGRDHVDKTVYTMSESTLSSSSANHINSSETHELEPLTDQENSSHSRELNHNHYPRSKSLHNNHKRSSHHRGSHSSSNGSLDILDGTKREPFLAIGSNLQMPKCNAAQKYIVMTTSDGDVRHSLLDNQEGTDALRRHSDTSDIWIQRSPVDSGIVNL